MLLLTAALVIAQVAPDVPNQQPWLAVSGKQVALAFGSGGNLYAATSSDEGRTFGSPVRLPSGLKPALGRHRGPRIAIAGKTLVVSAIMGSGVRGQDGDLVAWRSSDGGKTWSEPARINDVPSAAREGLHTMTAHGDRLFAAWLDLRSEGTRVYGASSKDGGVTWSKNVLVYESPDGTVCQCCHPTVTADASGNLYVMFRNALAGNRDMYVARSSDGGKTFKPAAKLGSGTWTLNACPMDGGALAVHNGRIVSVFRRDKEIIVAGVDKNETVAGTGRDPVLAVTKRGEYVAWTAPAGIQLLEPGAVSPRMAGPGGQYVHLTAMPGGGVIGAWEHEKSIVVQRLGE